MSRNKTDLLSKVTKPYVFTKFVGNNTLEIHYEDGTKAIRLHDTDIITYFADRIILNSGGFKTKTTKERLNNHLLNGIGIFANKGLWWITGLSNRNEPVEFYDGITINSVGDLISEERKSDLKKRDKQKRKIRDFVNQITKDNLPYPENGDCFICLFGNDTSCLSEIQKQQLIELQNKCPNEKLKRVLDAAIPRYLSGEVVPKQRSFGICINSDEVYVSELGSCCIIGASLIQQKREKSWQEDFEKYYGLNDDAFCEITKAFDGDEYTDSEISNCVAEIRKVIFGE